MISPNIQTQYNPQFGISYKNPIKTIRQNFNSRVGSPFERALEIYDDLWKELALPNSLKIPVELIEYDDCSLLTFTKFINLRIYINKNLSKLKMHLMNVTGITKAILRHEIEHLKEWWLEVRYCNADKFVENLTEEDLENIENLDNFIKYLAEIEHQFGKIKPEEIEDAIKYIKAYEEYPDIKDNMPNTISSFSYLIKYIKYINNDRERAAREAEKKYMPSKTKFIKTVVKEMWNIVTGKPNQSN